MWRSASGLCPNAIEHLVASRLCSVSSRMHRSIWSFWYERMSLQGPGLTTSPTGTSQTVSDLPKPAAEEPGVPRSSPPARRRNLFADLLPKTASANASPKARPFQEGGICQIASEAGRLAGQLFRGRPSVWMRSYAQMSCLPKSLIHPCACSCSRIIVGEWLGVQ